jgi:hypothetical protein
MTAGSLLLTKRESRHFQSGLEVSTLHFVLWMPGREPLRDK